VPRHLGSASQIDEHFDIIRQHRGQVQLTERYAAVHSVRNGTAGANQEVSLKSTAYNKRFAVDSCTHHSYTHLGGPGGATTCPRQVYNIYGLREQIANAEQQASAERAQRKQTEQELEERAMIRPLDYVVEADGRARLQGQEQGCRRADAASVVGLGRILRSVWCWYHRSIQGQIDA